MSDETKISDEEKAIRDKMAVGLSREQAVQVVKNQAEHDAALAAAEKKSKKEPR